MTLNQGNLRGLSAHFFQHLRISYPPKVAIPRLVSSLIGVFSRLIRKKHYPTIERALWVGACGPRVTLLVRQGGPAFYICGNIWSNRKRPMDLCGVSA